MTGSNRRPSACKADALPAELNFRIGAADEARTRYLHLGKVALYQMSYGRMYRRVLLSRSLRATGIIIYNPGAFVNYFFEFFEIFFKFFLAALFHRWKAIFRAVR